MYQVCVKVNMLDLSFIWEVDKIKTKKHMAIWLIYNFKF